MLDREVVERLEQAAARQYSQVVSGETLGELLRVYRMWMEAPRGQVIGQTADDYVSPPTGVIVLTDQATAIKGQRVRLVRDGEPGEG